MNELVGQTFHAPHAFSQLAISKPSSQLNGGGASGMVVESPEGGNSS